MVKPSEIFKRGGYNVCLFETDCATGVTTIKMYGFGWKRPRRFKVKNLGLEDEEIIEEELRGGEGGSG